MWRKVGSFRNCFGKIKISAKLCLCIGIAVVLSTWHCRRKPVLKIVKLTKLQQQDLNQPTQLVEKIPPELFNYIDTLVEQEDFHIQKCHPKERNNRNSYVYYENEAKNFTFIKTHKCASDTLSAIFRRFAMVRNLSVAIPINKTYILGWAHTLQPHMYRPAKTADGRHNVFLDHSVFNITYMRSVSPADTRYLATVREPFDRLKSSMLFFNFANRAGLPNEIDIVEAFLNNMQHLEGIYTSSDNAKFACIPVGVSVTRNAMAFDMGFPTGFHFGTTDQTGNYTYIKQWLTEIFDQVKVIMVVEHFHESLILLRRYMCWSWLDIVYQMKNSGGQKKKLEKRGLGNKVYNEQLVENYRQWNTVDTLLYHMANATLWRRITTLGADDFLQEVDAFEDHLSEILNHCRTKSKAGFSFKGNRWQEGYTVSRSFCALVNDKEALRQKLRDVYDRINVTVPNVMHGHKRTWC